MKNFVSVLASFIFACNSFVFASEPACNKLASRSNVPAIKSKYLPLVEIIVNKIQNGEMREEDIPILISDLNNFKQFFPNGDKEETIAFLVNLIRAENAGSILDMCFYQLLRPEKNPNLDINLSQAILEIEGMLKFLYERIPLEKLKENIRRAVSILKELKVSEEFAKVWLANPGLKFRDIREIINNGFRASFIGQKDGMPEKDRVSSEPRPLTIINPVRNSQKLPLTGELRDGGTSFARPPSTSQGIPPTLSVAFSNGVNRVEDFGADLPLLDYQNEGDYPKKLISLERALTICAVGRKKAVDGSYGALVAPAGMPAINMMIDSAIEKKGMPLSEIEIIVIEPPYGCTKNLFENWQRRGALAHSISVDEVAEKLPGLMNDKTAIIYGESITNPNLMRLDIENVLRVNKGRAAVLIDDTFATSEMIRSLEIETEVDGKKYSVDMAMIGLTKGASGTGNIISGAVAAKKEWLDLLARHRNSLPEHAEIVRAIRGLRHLEIRFAAQSNNTKGLNTLIGQSDLVAETVYPENGHMIYYVYKKLSDAIDNINLLSKFRTLINAVSLGQVRSLFERPSAGTHLTVAEDARTKGGISPSGIRGSIGIEGAEDIQREINALLEILEIYGEQIPEEDLTDINKIFMSEYVTQEEGKRAVKYLLPKWPIIHAAFEKLISDLPEPEKQRLTVKYTSNEKFRKAADILIKATEITQYDPVTIAIHHRLLWCLLSGDHTSVMASPIESTTAHKQDDKHMQGTFISLLEGKKKGFPPEGAYALYSRLGRPGAVTLELLMTLLETGAENALNYEYIGTSFYSERMAQKTFLEQQAEIVIMNAMTETHKLTSAQIEEIRQKEPGRYHKMQLEAREKLRKEGKEIVVVTVPGSPLFNQAMGLVQYDAVKFRVITPDDSSDIGDILGKELSKNTLLVYFDSLRLRNSDPVKIRDIVRDKNPEAVFGITDSFSLGYSNPRTERDFDFITHVIYYENSDYGAVIIAKNDRPLTEVWNNPYWSRKNRATAMSEDIAVTAMWYVLPYLRVFDERYEENINVVTDFLKGIAAVNRIDKRHIEIVFANSEDKEGFFSFAARSDLIDTDGGAGNGYFYINEWTSIRRSDSNPNALILRVGIENTEDLRREFGNITALKQEADRRMLSAREKIKRQISQYETLRGRISQDEKAVKNVFIDKDCLPENQRYILEGNEWDRRQKLLERMFPGYRFNVFSVGIEDGMSKDNCIVLGSKNNGDKFNGLDARLVLVQNAGENNYFPLDALICLGVGLLNLSDSDKQGSPLVSTIARMHKEITKSDIDVQEFLSTYRLSVILPMIERYSVSELMKLHTYAISLLEQSV